MKLGKLTVFKIFIYFWLCWVIISAQGLCLVAVSRGYYSLLLCPGFSLQWLLLLWSTDARARGFRSCSAWAPRWWCMCVVALWNVESSWTKGRNRVLCIGRLLLNHWTTREVLFKIMSFSRKLYAILFAQVFYIYLNIIWKKLSLFQKN